MILVELYSKEDCHLCDRALDVVRRVRNKIPFELHVIKLKEGDEQFEVYKERFPVVTINKEFAFQYRVPEAEMIEKLERALVRR